MYWFIFCDNRLLLEKEEEGSYTIPFGKHPPVPLSENPLTVPSTDDIVCQTGTADVSAEETDRYILVALRATWDMLEPRFYLIAGKASQLLYWERHSHFCPACGTATESSPLPVMRFCPSCRHELYPFISVAILALVRKGDEEILLVRARNFKGAFHGLVAGFLEIGETLEECVAREVKEETGLDVCNITYFGNQSWPFPSGLMVGFTADYAGGEIKLQEDELTDGAFYNRGNLPPLPLKSSLARQMIDGWLTHSSSLSK
ncbi:NADH pyrophosphatase [Bacteroidales bacterium Barb7]|nr:NADH pyrophosphatase [Bacteroidales bacterium Barb7]